MWDELGIAPCDDPRAIRRAYAARLRKLDPDRDPHAFARLRDALEQALQQATRREGGQSPAEDSDGPDGADDTEPSAAAEPIVEDPPTRGRTEARPRASTAPDVEVAAPPAPDQDDIRDRALLIALDAALRRGDAAEATALYYRAAATGALSLANAPDMIERLIAVAVGDLRLGAAAFRNLVRAVGLDAARARSFVDPQLRRRVMARLAADDWYDELLATAERRQGRVARNRRKIARLILGRIGRFWHPRVDREALKTWLAQYHVHEAWLGGRIDPRWIAVVEGRVRRRQIFWILIFCFLIGGLVLQFVWLSIAALIDGAPDVAALIAGPFILAFFLWILKLLATELVKLTFGGDGIAGLRARIRAFWQRLVWWSSDG
jgi:hypothetical protein